tara:strand:+ start:88 stop:282 length:195 start_codon:yes stop_codon:yes gene_type:complete
MSERESGLKRHRRLATVVYHSDDSVTSSQTMQGEKLGTVFPVEISLSPLELEEGLLISSTIRQA